MTRGGRRSSDTARRLHLLGPALVAVLLNSGLLAWAAAGAAQNPGLTRVRDLRQYAGAEVTVRGRTGQIVEAEEQEGVHVFTLRDDYGDVVHVRSTEDYPIMGATYDITGLPQVDAATDKLYLEASSLTKVYGGQATDVVITRTEAPRWLMPMVLGLILAGAFAVVLVVRGMVRARAAAGALPDAWGFVEVLAGPHQGDIYSLREDSTVIGRHLDRLKAVSLDEDRSVSRSHGMIVRDDNGVYYVDTDSLNGSFINEQRVTPQDRIPVAPGTMVRLGPTTVIRISRPEREDADQTRAPNAEVTGQWGDAPTERSPAP